MIEKIDFIDMETSTGDLTALWFCKFSLAIISMTRHST